MKNLLLAALMAASLPSVAAVASDVITEAGEMIARGDLDGARTILTEARARGNTDASLLLGRVDFLEYDFDGAARHYAAYKKNRRGRQTSSDLQTFSRQLDISTSFMQNVEDIAIIDSLAVDIDSFMTFYRLPQSAGRLLGPESIPFKESARSATMAFSSESGDFMMWAQPDSTGNMRLVESSRLTDGSWQSPVFAPESLGDGGDADYPFMMADGTTLYFASDGDGSMGGLDIFVATRDAATGEYLQPQNLGMPYNSPFDDYMLAIDEFNGVGWWATDRNLLDGKLTVYVFATNETRRNIDPDSEDAISRARIADWRATQTDPERDYGAMLAEIRKIKEPEPVRKADFHLPVGAGKEYTVFSDFRNPQAAALMKKWLELNKSYTSRATGLAEMRRRYAADRNPSLGNRILQTEAESEKELLELNMLKSEIYKLEKGEE